MDGGIGREEQREINEEEEEYWAKSATIVPAPVSILRIKVAFNVQTRHLRALPSYQ